MPENDDLFLLEFPPGLLRNGTVYMARGRWYDGHLIRWYEGTALGPVGGWVGVEREQTAAEIQAAQEANPQFARPTSNIELTDSGTFADIDEATPNDADYVRALLGDGEVDACEFGLGAVTDPVLHTLHTITVRMGTNLPPGPPYPTVVVSLKEGATTRYTSVVTDVADAVANYTFTLSAGEAGSITNYTTLRIRVVMTGIDPGPNPMALDITQMFFSCPGVADTALVPVDLSGVPRTMLSWRANDQRAILAIGTHEKLYVLSEGALTDLTPVDEASIVGLDPGNEHTFVAVGRYGIGAYGAGLYGVGNILQGELVEAATWQLDTFGQYLIACPTWDERIFYWDTVADTLIEVDGAPTAKGIVVTPEGFLVALGAAGNVRGVQWPDQQTLDDWIPTAENQAGDKDLQTNGQIMCGRRMRSETLIWTDQDVHTMRYIGGTLVYGFDRLGDGCGITSRNAVAVVEDTKAFWMGDDNFFGYEGFVKPILCEVYDAVFRNFNKTQRAKVVAVPNQGFGEVTWFYPSATSDENDRYVTYSYRHNYWATGPLVRTAGVDRSPFEYPVWAGSDGTLYEHERGTDYDGEVPFAESGPVEVGSGGRVMELQELVPDENTLGDVALTIKGALYPTGTERTYGPFTATEPTTVRVAARQVRVRLDQVTPNWRFGPVRVRLVPAGQR